MKAKQDNSSINGKADIHIHFTEFDLPPMQDVLLIGRRAPIGPEAVRRMVDALAPGQYEVVLVNDSAIEAVAVKKKLFNWVSRDKLISILIKEAGKLTDESSLVKAKLEISISVFKEVEL